MERKLPASTSMTRATVDSVSITTMKRPMSNTGNAIQDVYTSGDHNCQMLLRSELPCAMGNTTKCKIWFSIWPQDFVTQSRTL